MDEPLNFLARLKQHHLYGVVVAYAVVVGFLIQLVSRAFPYFGWASAVPVVIIVLLLGFPAVVVLAWLFIKPKDPAKSDTWQRRHWKLSAVVTVVVIVLVVVSGFYGVRFSERRAERLAAASAIASGPKPTIAVAPMATTVIPAKSVAVLPFVNEGGDKEQQYFSDGLSEDFITALSQFAGLKVIGRNSAFQFRDSKDSAQTIGAKLGVAYLLEGSVRRQGDEVRISAELIDTRDASTLWSQHYDRRYKNLFALQDDITHAVAGTLQAKLMESGGAVVQSDRPPSGSLAAYTAYLQGRFHFARETEADYRQAIAQYQAAIKDDPRYALAWAWLSRAWTGLALQFLSGQEAQQAYAKSRSAANTALALEPNLAEAYVARGYALLIADFDWTGAEAQYRQAQHLAPNNGESLFNLGNLLAALGHPEQAVVLARQALATDPLHASWYQWLASYLSGLGSLDEAAAAIHKAIELQPAAVGFQEQLTIIEIQRGDAKAALVAAQAEPPGVWQEIALAMARQIGPDRAAADAALKHLIEKWSDNAPYQIAEVYALRRDPDNMYKWLDRAWTSRDSGIQALLFDPFILRYQHDPRFAAFCNKVGLPTTTEAKAMP